ncbi:PREDICTED: caspase-1-like, partial [Rhagoletis zephyria]|uniref:caspase-1-like n=1 Tax=Rhagoletis zephyria TaxID=28612 RepID=UPI00081177C5
LLCSDGEINEDLLIDSFTPDACPTLAGKPKMIFIQACRGRKLDAGYQLVVDGHGPGGSFPWSTSSSSALVPAKIPTHADFLVYRSTYAGHYSWRNSVNGSWFIQDLTGVLRRFAIQRSSSFDLMTLLTLVNREVAFKRQSRVPVDENDDDERKEMNGKKEMPVFS